MDKNYEPLYCFYRTVLRFFLLLKFDIIRRGVIAMAPGLSPGLCVTQPEITKSTWSPESHEMFK